MPNKTIGMKRIMKNPKDLNQFNVCRFIIFLFRIKLAFEIEKSLFLLRDNCWNDHLIKNGIYSDVYIIPR